MYTKQEIILKSYREGRSQRQISRELQINRKTVKRYIEDYEKHQHAPPPTECNKLFSSHLSSPPEYTTGDRKKRRLTDAVIAAIDVHIACNRKKIEFGQRKQVLKKIDIYESLQQQGFDVGYTTVCNYIRKGAGAPTSKEAFIRQAYQPGSVCEFDWGEIKLEINGSLGRYYLAVFTTAYSNYRYALIFHRQDTLAFMESHVSFFAHIGGVYHQMTYDNMRVAVARFVGAHEKEPTQALLQMRGHYMFAHRFCNVYSGNEKGHVERSVEYIRRKAFGPIQAFATLDQAMVRLGQSIDKINHTKQQLTGKSAVEMFEEERQFLYKSPSPMACSESTPLRVDKYSTVCYGTNHYSVPDNLIESYVDVKIYGHKLEIFYKNALLSTHERCFGRHQWIISIEHYLTTFKRKPGALASSVALAGSPYLKTLYDKYFIESPRDFIDLLQFCIHFNVDQARLEDTVERLVRLCGHQMTTEKITAILGNKNTDMPVPVVDNSETTMQSQKLLTELTAILN
jgi:transposase